MSGNSDGNKDFHEQLRMQELYGQKPKDGDDPYTFVDPEDGTVYDWDHDKKAWFPKITEDFMAAYQANYGFSEEGTQTSAAGDAPGRAPKAASGETPGQAAKATTGEIPVQASNVTAEQTPAEGARESAQGSDAAQPKESKPKGEKRKADPGWFNLEEDKNTNVYVSGLPPDITPEEFAEIMSKCGIVMRDPITEQYKVKLYKDNEGNLKGDGLCCYLKRESVGLALRLLDESEVRGYQLHVEVAHFELKGQYDASKKKKRNKDYRKKLQQQQKQLDWRPEKAGEARKRHERVLIIRNMFHPSEFEEDPLVLNEIRDDLRTECEKFGQVKKVIIFDRHPDGVASVAFKEPEDADVCQMALEGRWFGGKKLSAQLWDGTTDYQVEETTREREERLKGWGTFLEGKGKEENGGNEVKDGSNGDRTGEHTVPSEAGPGEAPEAGQGPEEAPDSSTCAAGPAEVHSTDSSMAGSDEDDT
ncbi:17S U2 SnRNP complex component HTATSF1 [Paramormyrops kingsleyae]|uniref:17S U2 SnRNP complex component HTATSF1 n=1 Tax=Paramormyrops kingsleyae TaxID=1676925 RepID=UPI003B972C92